MVAGIETCTCTACRNRALKGRTMATVKSDTTPYVSTTFPQFATRVDDDEGFEWVDGVGILAVVVRSVVQVPLSGAQRRLRVGRPLWLPDTHEPHNDIRCCRVSTIPPRLRDNPRFTVDCGYGRSPVACSRDIRRRLPAPLDSVYGRSRASLHVEIVALRHQLAAVDRPVLHVSVSHGRSDVVGMALRSWRGLALGRAHRGIEVLPASTQKNGDRYRETVLGLGVKGHALLEDVDAPRPSGRCRCSPPR